MLLEEATVNEGEDSVQTFGRLFEAFLLEIESMDPKNLKRLGDIADAHREIYSSTPAAIQYLSDFFYEICVQARIDPQTVGREVFGREVGDELDKDFINATTRVHLQRTIAITEKKAKSNEKGSKAARKLYKKMMEDLVRI